MARGGKGEGRPAGRKADREPRVEVELGRSAGSNAFGRNLRHLRRERDLTIERLAEFAEMTPNYVGNLERGERKPSLKSIEKLAKGLGVTTADLLRVADTLSHPAKTDRYRRQMETLWGRLDQAQKQKLIRFVRDILL